MIRFVLLALALGAQLNASTVYTTFGPGDTFQNFGDGVGQSINMRWADPFTVSWNTQVTGYRVAMNQIGTGTTVLLSLWSGPTEPTTLIENNISIGPVTSLNTSIFSASSPTNPHLAPGTTYWLVATVPNPATDIFRWAWSDQSGFSRMSIINGGSWSALAPPGDAFEILGTVPEPTTGLLCGLGLLLLAGVANKLLSPLNKRFAEARERRSAVPLRESE